MDVAVGAAPGGRERSLPHISRLPGEGLSRRPASQAPAARLQAPLDDAAVGATQPKTIMV
jgi:hypothetical protein